MKNQLHIFNHGIGDTTQFTSVIKHIKKKHPSAKIDILCDIGKDSCFVGLVDNIYTNNVDITKYDRVFKHTWQEVNNCYADYPSTKVVKCIAETLKLPIYDDLLTYTINIKNESYEKVDFYLNALDIKNGYVLIHYQANTLREKKDLSHDLVLELCKFIISKNFVPVILDWDFRSPLPNNKTIFCPDVKNPLWENIGTGDAGKIAALISKAAIFIGVDSGPLHIAMTTNTPTYGVWKQHHPIYFADFAENTTHIIPKNNSIFIRGSNKDKCIEYFNKKYTSIIYDDLKKVLLDVLDKNLYINKTFAKMYDENNEKKLNSFKYDENYYNEHRIAGLDYINYGDWQKKYGQWIVEVFSLKNKKVLDIGCACGSIANGLYESGANVDGIDINNYTILIGKERFKHLNLNVCDAINMHLYPDNFFDFIHTNQVAEHWRPEHVQLILREIYRVLKPNGIFLCVLDTEELYLRQKRDPDKEDPTHVCIRPMSWWKNLLEKEKFEIINNIDFVRHSLSYLKKYDWDWFLVKKVSEIKLNKNKLFN